MKRFEDIKNKYMVYMSPIGTVLATCDGKYYLEDTDEEGEYFYTRTNKKFAAEVMRRASGRQFVFGK